MGVIIIIAGTRLEFKSRKWELSTKFALPKKGEHSLQIFAGTVPTSTRKRSMTVQNSNWVSTLVNTLLRPIFALIRDVGAKVSLPAVVAAVESLDCNAG